MADGTTPDGYIVGVTADGFLIAYPLCCGLATQLGIFGWRCAQCGRVQPFAYTKKGQSMKWGKRLVTKDQMALKQQEAP